MFFTLRLLLLYTRHSLKWGNTLKQERVLSPNLFAIYTDGLLKRLEETGVGCYTYGQPLYLGSCYADDITLLAPCKSTLTILVSVCEKYASEFDILFNGSTSKW